MVILCERSHPEVTQYDMIYGLVSDPRFEQHVGHIFTEIGSVTLQPYIETLLMNDQLTDEQVNEKLRYIARNMGHDAGWEKTIFYDFLKKLFYLNRSLPKERQVHAYPTDLDIRWEDATKETWTAFEMTKLNQRDRLEADNIISKFNEIRQAGGQCDDQFTDTTARLDRPSRSVQPNSRRKMGCSVCRLGKSGHWF